MVMHTHFYGRVVSAWRVRRNIAGNDEWKLLGKRHPLVEPQSFYPIGVGNRSDIPNLNVRNINHDIEDNALLYGDTIAFRWAILPNYYQMVYQLIKSIHWRRTQNVTN